MAHYCCYIRERDGKIICMTLDHASDTPPSPYDFAQNGSLSPLSWKDTSEFVTYFRGKAPPLNEIIETSPSCPPFRLEHAA